MTPAVLASNYRTHTSRANEARMRRDGAVQGMHAERAQAVAERFADMIGSTTEQAVAEIRKILQGVESCPMLPSFQTGKSVASE